MTKPQAFVYNAFDHINRIHTLEGHNRYKKTFQQINQKGIWNINNGRSVFTNNYKMCMLN